MNNNIYFRGYFIMKKFRACVVGVGFIGAVHVEQLRRLGNVEVVAIADPAGAEDKAAALCVPKAYSDYKEMLDTEKPDTVHICVPNNLHYEVAMYAMERHPQIQSWFLQTAATGIMACIIKRVTLCLWKKSKEISHS